MRIAVALAVIFSFATSMGVYAYLDTKIGTSRTEQISRQAERAPSA